MKNSLWWIFSALLVVLLGVWAFFPHGKGQMAVVRQGGRVVDQVVLAQLEEPFERTYYYGSGMNRVRFSVGGVEVVASDCPDQICVRRGMLSRAGETAACLPHQFTLSVEGEADEDAQIQ